MPPPVIQKGLRGPGLLGHVICAKYLKHGPLYRVQQELERYGVNVSRATLCVLGGWVEAAAVALQPLWRGIQAGLMAGDYLQADETPVGVLGPEPQGKAATGCLWVYGRPKGDVLFDFRSGVWRMPDASSTNPREMIPRRHGGSCSSLPGFTRLSDKHAPGMTQPDWRRGNRTPHRSGRQCGDLHPRHQCQASRSRTRWRIRVTFSAASPLPPITFSRTSCPRTGNLCQFECKRCLNPR